MLPLLLAVLKTALVVREWTISRGTRKRSQIDSAATHSKCAGWVSASTDSSPPLLQLLEWREPDETRNALIDDSWDEEPQLLERLSSGAMVEHGLEPGSP